MIGNVTTREKLTADSGWEAYGSSEYHISFAGVGEEVIDACQRQVRRLAVAVGERAYVCPLWSRIESGVVCFKDGYVWLVWRPTSEGNQGVYEADARRYVVVFRPDGEIEEFPGFMASIIGGKVFSIRPPNWADPGATKSDLSGPHVAVWGDVQGQQFPEIRCIVDAGGVPVYMAREDGRYWRDFPQQSTKVVMRHPDTVLYRGRSEAWYMISRTPDARPESEGVFGVPDQILVMPDGTPLWAIREGKVVTIFRDRSPILSGDIIAFHRREEDKVLTVIERTPGDGRVIHELR